MPREETTYTLPYARKYRPSRLAELYGNTRVKTSIRQMLSGNVRPQVILISGPAGSGKTTLGRLLAQEYRCENYSEVMGSCGECGSCKTFQEYIKTGDDGLFMDIREYNLSRDTGKSSIDRIEDEAQIPTGDWRVFILDECHRASRSAQDSLLKLLEEPPEKVLFILCTTNPEMLLSTVLSRCQYKLHVEKPSRNEAVQLLASICDSEGLEYDNKGISLIAAKEDYTPRDMLNRLEQVVREKHSVTFSDASDVLNETADKFYAQFYESLLKRENVSEFIALIGKIRVETDLKQFVDGLVKFTVRGIYCYNGVHVDGLDPKEVRNLSAIFGSFTHEEISVLLGELLEIQHSKDVESKLLLLAYRGIQVKKDTLDATDNVDISVPKEQASFDATATKNFKAAQEVTPEQVEKIAKSATDQMDVDDILAMFNATEVLDGTGVDTEE